MLKLLKNKKVLGALVALGVAVAAALGTPLPDWVASAVNVAIGTTGN